MFNVIVVFFQWTRTLAVFLCASGFSVKSNDHNNILFVYIGIFLTSQNGGCTPKDMCVL